MRRLSSSKLLRLADTYLSQSHSRYWALAGLISLAEDLSEDSATQERTNQLPPKNLSEDTTSSNVFPVLKDALSGLIGRTITAMDWESWLRSNQTVLGNFTDLQWKIPEHINNAISAIYSPSPEQWIDVYITTYPQDPKGVNVGSSSSLRGTGQIPNLWLFVGEYIGEPTPSSAKKELAHYDWVFRALTSISPDRFKEGFNANAEAFVTKHKSRLDSIRRLFAREPRYLGGGSDGIAFDIGNRRILKIFSDQYAYRHALQAVERLHKNPLLARTEAMIYDLGQIGNFDAIPIYYYVMERMVAVDNMTGIKEPLRQIIGSTIQLLYGDREFWRDIKRGKDFTKDAEFIISKVKVMAKQYAELITGDQENNIQAIENAYSQQPVKIDPQDPKEHDVPLSKNWLNSLVEEIIMKYLTGRTDLHLGNLGVTAYGEFRYFDPAYEKWQSNINLPKWKPEVPPEIDWGDVEF